MQAKHEPAFADTVDELIVGCDLESKGLCQLGLRYAHIVRPCLLPLQLVAIVQ
jgi:hypothetical protein